MWVPLSYLSVVLIWSTTPLAIKWSGEGVGFLFGVTGRMLIGTLLALFLLLLLGLRLPWTRQARHTYMAAGLGLYGAMSSVYWGAQHIPSGWVSVLYGVTPIATGILAGRLLGERAFTPLKTAGMLLGVAGLGIMFLRGTQLSAEAVAGIAAVLLSVVIHSLSSVLVKRIGLRAPGIVVAAGGLLVALPAYLLTWLISGAQLPARIEPHTGWSILYLGSVATVIGFTAYYHVLEHVSATRVAFLTVLTPVIALWLGRSLNAEPISWFILVGSAMILGGLTLFEAGERRSKTASRIPAAPD